MDIRLNPTQAIFYLLLAMSFIACGGVTDADGFGGDALDSSHPQPTIVLASGHHILPTGKVIDGFTASRPNTPTGTGSGNATVFSFDIATPLESVVLTDDPAPRDPPVTALPACHDVTAIYNGSYHVQTDEDLLIARQYAEFDGDLVIPGNISVETIELPCLRKVTGTLMKPGCSSTPVLRTLSFPRLETASKVDIWATQGLEEIHLPSLTETGGIRFEYNFKLKKVNLDSLEMIENDLVITDGEASSFTFPNLKAIGGSLRIKNFATLVTIDLPAVESMGGIDFRHLGTLETFAFMNLDTLGSLHVMYNPALTGFQLPGVGSIPGAFNASHNPSLPFLSLSSLETVGSIKLDSNGSMEFVHLPSLKEAAGFSIRTQDGSDWCPTRWISLPSLEKVANNMTIASLLSLEAVLVPKLSEIGQSLLVMHTETFTTLSLPSLTLVGHDLKVHGDQHIASIELPLLAEVGGNLNIEDGWWMLESIHLPSLESVGGNLRFDNNHLIEALPFDVLTHVGLSVHIEENSSLPSCSVETLLEQLAGESDLTHGIWTEGNLDDCECDSEGSLIEGSCS